MLVGLRECVGCLVALAEQQVSLGDPDDRPHERGALPGGFGELCRCGEVLHGRAAVTRVSLGLPEHDLEPHDGRSCPRRTGSGERRVDQGPCLGEATAVDERVRLVDEVGGHASSRLPLRQLRLALRAVVCCGDRLAEATDADAADAAGDGHVDAHVRVADLADARDDVERFERPPVVGQQQGAMGAHRRGWPGFGEHALGVAQCVEGMGEVAVPEPCTGQAASQV